MQERAHSKFSASGSERWFNCPGSVALSEGLPDRGSAAASEGTDAHALLEKILLCELSGNDYADTYELKELLNISSKEMRNHALQAAKFIFNLHKRYEAAELMVETKIFLDFIHPEMFGTFDSAILDHFGTLHVFDFKYGSHTVSPKENLQMLFYGVGLAHKFKWNFIDAKLWIIQPRVKGYDGPTYWSLPIEELKGYVDVFSKAVERVEKKPKSYKEGNWCFFCRARGICPLKQETKNKRAIEAFGYDSVNF